MLHEARGEWDAFRLLHRQLAGLAVKFGVLAVRSPEHPFDAFKAREQNRVLLLLKEQKEQDMKTSLCLVSEEEANTYSDISFIIRMYLDVCAVYVRRYYEGNPPVIPPVPPDWTARLIQDQILMFCMDRPRSILEIGALLGYKNKKRSGSISLPSFRRGWSSGPFRISPTTTATSGTSLPAISDVFSDL